MGRGTRGDITIPWNGVANYASLKFRLDVHLLAVFDGFGDTEYGK
jgi:hypothetical protein